MDILEEVKVALSITTDDEAINRNLNIKINAVKKYLFKAGLIIQDEESLDEEVIACIATGVNDLLNNKAGETRFSPAFNMLAMQICRG